MLRSSPFFRGFLSGFRYFGEIVVGVFNTLLLTIIYFISVGPTAFILKIRNKQLLNISFSFQPKSYWEDLNIQTRSLESHYRQF